MNVKEKVRLLEPDVEVVETLDVEVDVDVLDDVAPISVTVTGDAAAVTDPNPAPPFKPPDD